MSWILACDDHAHITRLVELTLAKAGWDVVTCPDGLAAWNTLQQREAPSLIISDYQMPRMDGLALIRMVRDQAEFTQVPIILLTAKGLELSEQQLRRTLGISAVMVKPFSPRQLRSTVDSLVTEALVRQQATTSAAAG